MQCSLRKVYDATQLRNIYSYKYKYKINIDITIPTVRKYYL